MITGILIGFILFNIGAPTIIWVAYGSYWVAWLLKVIFTIAKGITDGK